MEWIHEPQAWVALVTLTFLEIVLGIDNVVFISIMSGKLPKEQQAKARRAGLALAMVMRLALLSLIGFIVKLVDPLFGVLGKTFTYRDLILLGGGLFLMWKSVTEIHHKLEGEDTAKAGAGTVSFGSVLVQIALLDLVFSLDSVITAVGMVSHLQVMVLAVLISVAVMVAFVNSICAFVERHPTVKMLALSFLLLVGFTLMGEGLGLHIPHGYVYFAMAFSIAVEFLNLKLRKRGQPVHLRGAPEGTDHASG